MSKLGKWASAFIENAVDKMNTSIVGENYTPGPNNNNLISHAAASDDRMANVEKSEVGSGTIYAPNAVRKTTALNTFK